ncbi:hypothetical protein ABZ714_06715 [Streptomyces sp. NPDC006798]|uniref:hypothetical protein n=1 Tax=Streptomyces sp. NPDC006798 TaxID=3155462 RepID=UPI0033DC1698
MSDLNPEIRLRLHAERAERLRRSADAAHLAARVRAAGPRTPALRVRAGWALVHLGLQLIRPEEGPQECPARAAAPARTRRTPPRAACPERSERTERTGGRVSRREPAPPSPERGGRRPRP